MIIKIVGIEEQNFTFDDGKTYTGRKLHVIDREPAEGNMLGEKVSVIKLASTNRFYNLPLTVGEEYAVYFDQKGKVDFIGEVK